MGQRKRQSTSAADFIPERPTLSKLRASAKSCRGCNLYRLATQTVFGEGPKRAKLMLVGEQPGDAEDKTGEPFVGPAGGLLDRALEAAGVDREEVYVTNVVKHFKWKREEGMKKRIHSKPSAAEVRACMPWLVEEVALVKPEAIVCLGATAARAMLGSTFSVTRKRAVPIESEWAPLVFATVHPSAVLRAPSEKRAREERAFFRDVERIARQL